MSNTSNWKVGYILIVLGIVQLTICYADEFSVQSRQATYPWISMNGNEGSQSEDRGRRVPIWGNAYQRCKSHLKHNFERKNFHQGVQSDSMGQMNSEKSVMFNYESNTYNLSTDAKSAAGLSLIECGTSPFERVKIVNEHNLLRSVIAQGILPSQPRGANLKKMIWDARLAAAAEYVARTGSFINVQVNDTRFPVGQNIFIQVATQLEKSDWLKAIMAWFNEHIDYKFGPTSPGSNAGHYTQIVWAETNMIGCARCHFSKQSSRQLFHAYVCQYGPAGNFIGQKPYIEGTEGCPFLC